MYKVMLTYPLYGEGMEILREQTDLFISNSGDITPFIHELKNADALITRNVHVTNEILIQCPKLKVIGIPGVGYHNWDLTFLTENGIALAFCPGTNTRSVAEHAVAMAYAITKNIVELDNESKKGNYAIRNSFRSIEIIGCNIGIIGFGNIGKETARIFKNNDTNVHVYDPYVKKEEVERLGYIYVDNLHSMLRICDIISLHVPSVPETRGMISVEEFKAMKDGAFLINCARGDIVDEKALYNALISKKVAGAALDVMVQEPFDTNNPLLSMPNVIVTPHVAGVTKEAANKTYKLIVETTLKLLNGHRVTNVANPQVFEHEKWS